MITAAVMSKRILFRRGMRHLHEFCDKQLHCRSAIVVPERKPQGCLAGCFSAQSVGASEVRRVQSDDGGGQTGWKENLALDLEDFLIDSAFEEVSVLSQQICRRFVLDSNKLEANDSCVQVAVSLLNHS